MKKFKLDQAITNTLIFLGLCTVLLGICALCVLIISKTVG